ncbi:deoxyribonuclease-2-beta isoform X2 [Rhinichthys klamathensis goyatoka]|uniref:deoxyribonuclease-2-beta isoform X2 n=1 Tax=Rhinichthys klamathensis goyatoka TaxID=3034132 RepID=UPI0024B5495F|nr:deoxyribonuclease-2-beta isoform X2 [Rhinichthys klamathensis goyatoka]
MSMLFQLCVCILLFLIGFSEAVISCLNENGQPVDWFIIYKLPIYKMDVKGSGVDYMYLDPSVMDFQMSKNIVNSSKGALGRTLTQLYSGYTSNSSVYMLYNDAPPELKYPSKYGHTKERNYSYPSTGKYYGQTLLCITYNYSQFPQISLQLAYLNPRMYNCSVPGAFRQDIAEMAQICDGKTPALKNRRSLQKLKSVGGQTFFSFAKSRNYVDDIYTGWVAQALGTDLLVESWLHQAHQLPSNCSLPRHVMNINRVCLPGPQMFRSYEDHSKWCVSYAFKDQWICLGDLNRDSGQAGRGGGLICSQNSIIYKAFRQAMAGYKHC